MKKHRICYAFLVVGAAVIWLFANTPEALTFLTLLILISLILAGTQWMALRGFALDGSIPAVCRIGQKIPLTLKIHRKNKIPMGIIQIRGSVKNILFQSSQDLTLTIQPSEKNTQGYHYLAEMENCGNVHISLTEAACMDMLGLFSWKMPLDIQMEIMVYPAQMQLQARTIRRPEAIFSGELYDQNRKGTDVSEVASLRDYVPGDTLGSVHWKLSSKLDNLVVREFGYPSNYQVLILYDLVRSTDGTEISAGRNNAVLALTAALSYQMLEQHMEHNVGRMVNGEHLSLPVYSMGTYDNMLTSLLCHPITEQAGSGDTIYQVLQKDLRSLYTKLIYITPSYEESTLKQVAREMDVTVIQVVEKTENSYVDTAGYAVIAVSEQEYQNKTYHIEI